MTVGSEKAVDFDLVLFMSKEVLGLTTGTQVKVSKW